jgi:hypothetical protein
MSEASFPSSLGRSAPLTDKEHRRRLLEMQRQWKIPQLPKKKRNFHEWPNTPVFSELIYHWKISKTSCTTKPSLASVRAKSPPQSKKSNHVTVNSLSQRETVGLTESGHSPHQHVHIREVGKLLATSSSSEHETVRKRMSIAMLCS